MGYGIKIGRKENLIAPDLSTINDPRQSINYGSSYFVGPKDWCEEEEEDVETYFYHAPSENLSKKLKSLRDFSKEE